MEEKEHKFTVYFNPATNYFEIKCSICGLVILENTSKWLKCPFCGAGIKMCNGKVLK